MSTDTPTLNQEQLIDKLFGQELVTPLNLSIIECLDQYFNNLSQMNAENKLKNQITAVISGHHISEIINHISANQMPQSNDFTANSDDSEKRYELFSKQLTSLKSLLSDEPWMQDDTIELNHKSWYSFIDKAVDPFIKNVTIKTYSKVKQGKLWITPIDATLTFASAHILYELEVVEGESSYSISAKNFSVGYIDGVHITTLTRQEMRLIQDMMLGILNLLNKVITIKALNVFQKQFKNQPEASNKKFDYDSAQVFVANEIC